MNKLLRIRFKSDADDPRPIKWPVPHPYWISAEGDGYVVLISYASDEGYILKNWPEAWELEAEEADGYCFSDRFPKPDWFTQQ